MNMRELTDEEKVLLAEFRLCEEKTQAEIREIIHRKATAAKAAEGVKPEQTDVPK